MKDNSDIAIENICEGDIYYFNLNKKYFFLQILKIVTDLPAPYDIDFKYGYLSDYSNITEFKYLYFKEIKSEVISRHNILTDTTDGKNYNYFSIRNKYT